MEIEQTVSYGTPLNMVNELNFLRNRIHEEVLIPYLKTREHDTCRYGPAEFFVKMCDFAVSSQHFCTVKLVGVSFGSRNADHLMMAQRSLEEIYTDVIKRNVLKGTRVQLFVRIMLDSPSEEIIGSNLLESKPIWIEGEGN